MIFSKRKKINRISKNVQKYKSFKIFENYIRTYLVTNKNSDLLPGVGDQK